MRYGIAVWNFLEPNVPLPALVDEFAGMGFDAVSFSSGQFPKTESAEWREVGALLRERGMIATIHNSFQVPVRDIVAAVACLDGSVAAVTFDAAMAVESRGRLYDWQCMGPALVELEGLTRDRAVQFGVEDFPLDQAALDFYADSIPPAVLDSPRLGMLVDLGHLHLRISQDAYFSALTPEAYLGRAALPVMEVHVHDNNGDKDTHGPIGLGDASFAAMARGLRALGFDGVSTIEIAPSFHGSTPAKSKPLAAESLATWRELMEAPA